MGRGYADSLTLHPSFQMRTLLDLKKQQGSNQGLPKPVGDVAVAMSIFYTFYASNKNTKHCFLLADVNKLEFLKSLWRDAIHLSGLICCSPRSCFVMTTGTRSLSDPTHTHSHTYIHTLFSPRVWISTRDRPTLTCPSHNQEACHLSTCCDPPLTPPIPPSHTHTHLNVFRLADVGRDVSSSSRRFHH